MKFEYDEDVDAAYINLKHPIEEGDAKKTVKVNDNLILDYDAKGKLIGIEILHASKILNKEALAKKVAA